TQFCIHRREDAVTIRLSGKIRGIQKRITPVGFGSGSFEVFSWIFIWQITDRWDVFIEYDILPGCIVRRGSPVIAISDRFASFILIRKVGIYSHVQEFGGPDIKIESGCHRGKTFPDLD